MKSFKERLTHALDVVFILVCHIVYSGVVIIGVHALGWLAGDKTLLGTIPIKYALDIVDIVIFCVFLVNIVKELRHE